MFPALTFTCSRSAAIDAFQAFRRRGLLTALLAKLTGKPPTLEEFGCYADRLHETRRYLGLQTIPVQAIIGSVGRSRDFDYRFRPLKKHLCDRWAGALLRSGTDSWPPIQVNKVGEDYFVEDGHHRVSVANYLGMIFIQAEVWEYPPQAGHAGACQPSPSASLKRQAQVAPAHG
jgi:hypothetical protein